MGEYRHLEERMESRKLAEGEILKDRYRITGVLGEGSYGVVYLADDITAGGARWAVKEVFEGALTDDERRDALELFAQEAGILRGLNHPGVPKVVDSFSFRDRHYMVMEYIEGETVEANMKRPLSTGDVLAWGMRLCDILEYLHRQEPPIIFRDLKPSNIMVTPRGRVVLIDFGIARLFNPLKKKDTYVLGTPGFCPPEQYGTGQSDPRSDLYALCATMHFMLSREELEQFNFAIPPLSRFRPDVPVALDRVLQKGLVQDPHKRYPSAGALREALHRVTAAPATRAGGTTQAGSAFPSIGWLWFAFFLLWAASSILPISSLLPMVPFVIMPLYIIAGFIHVPTRHERAQGMIVSACIIILMLVLVPNFNRARIDGAAISCKSNMKTLAQALEMYQGEHERLYPPSLGALTPMYLKTLPVCMLTIFPDVEVPYFPEPWWKKLPPCSYSYERNNWCDNYTITCHAPIHEKLCGSPGFPLYCADFGLFEYRDQTPGPEDKNSPYCFASLESCRRNVASLSQALETYAREHHGLYPPALAALVPRYIQEVPRCPSSWDTRGSPYAYKTEAGMKVCHLFCNDGVHRVLSGKKATPRFDSDGGISE
jgi:predicted Ser/Thr protein kinase